jgi:hypothetical protein
MIVAASSAVVGASSTKRRPQSATMAWISSSDSPQGSKPIEHRPDRRRGSPAALPRSTQSETRSHGARATTVSRKLRVSSVIAVVLTLPLRTARLRDIHQFLRQGVTPTPTPAALGTHPFRAAEARFPISPKIRADLMHDRVPVVNPTFATRRPESSN